MKHRIFLFFVFFTTGMCAVGANAQEKSPQRSMREIVMMPVLYRVPGMDKVAVRSGLKYTEVNDPNLRMDVYAPPNLSKGEKIPAVIFIHGGAGSEYTPKDWGIYTSWGRLIGASGLAAVTFTHRLAPQRRSLEDAASDLASAINYVRSNADALNIDKNRLCLAAYSAGGPLLVSAMRDRPEYIRCLVNFYAFMDIRQSGNLFTVNESKEALQKFSPIDQLGNNAGGIAPIFIARAGLDQIPTLDDSIDRFIREALVKNAALTVFNHPNGIHGFDSQTDDERSREIIQSAIAFMKSHLGEAKSVK